MHNSTEPRKNDSLKTGFENLEFYNKELIILGAKNNNGEVGDIHILFHPATNSFIYSENLE